MKRQYNAKYDVRRAVPTLLAVLVAGVMAGCGGGSSSPGAGVNTAATATVQAAGAAASWTSVKWGGGGYVTGLVYHPVNASLLYARTDVGGIYRWNASNSTWMALTDGLGFGGGEGRFHDVESLALDPTNDQKV